MCYLCLRKSLNKMDEPQLCWYAMKVFYNKVFEMEACLGAQGYTTYLATDKVLLKGEDHGAARRKLECLKADGLPCNRYVEEGPVIYQRVPMISSLLFVQAGAEGIAAIDNTLHEGKYPAQGFIYKVRNDKDGRYRFAVIPDSEMASFRRITSKGSDGLEFFSADDISRFCTGNKVRVIEGPFKGAEGYIKRIRRDRRLLVTIEGIVAIATAYIEPRFLETIGQ